MSTEPICTTVSLAMHKRLSKFAKANGFSVKTKAVLFMLANQDQPVEDYTYNSSKAKNIVLTVSSKKKSEIETRAAEHDMKPSAFIRGIINGYLINHDNGR